MNKVITGALILSVLAVISPSTSAAPAGNRSAFCGVWQRVCDRTCPNGPGNCKPVCAERHSVCLSTGCFRFNRPSPRCDINPKDVGLTDPKYAPRNRNR